MGFDEMAEYERLYAYARACERDDLRYTLSRLRAFDKSKMNADTLARVAKWEEAILAKLDYHGKDGA